MAATTADVVVAGAGHNALIAAAYLAKAGHEVLLLDARPAAGGAAVDRGADAARLPFRLLLHRTHADPAEPGAPRRRARAEVGVRAQLRQPGPDCARRLPGRRVVHPLARPRPDARGDLPLLATRRRDVPAGARRVRGDPAAGRRLPLQPDRLCAAARRRPRRPAALAAPHRLERVRRDPARVREPALPVVSPLAGVPDRAAGRLARLGAARLLDRRGAAGAELDAAARRLGRAAARAPRLPRRPGRDGGLWQARRRARRREGPLHGRRHRRRRALARAQGRAFLDPRQVARRHGAPRGVGRRLPRRDPDVRPRHLDPRPVLRDDGGARAPRPRRDADRGLGGGRGLAGGRARGGPRGARGGAPACALAADCDADSRRSLSCACRQTHGQAPEHGPVERRRLGDAEARGRRGELRGDAARRPEHDAGRRPRRARQEPGRHRAGEPAHVARHDPRRRPLLPERRPAPPGPRLGAAPDADPRPLPDRRHHASRAARSPAARAGTRRS